MNENDESSIRFVADLQERFAEIEVDEPELDPSGIIVVEHSDIRELDEETQNKLLRLYEAHEMRRNKPNVLKDP